MLPVEEIEVLKRRALLVGSAAVAAAAAVGAFALRDRSNRQRFKDAFSGLVPPARPLGAATGSLSAPQADAIAALAEVLYPPQPGLDAGAFARLHAAARCERDPGYLTEYGSAVRLLDETAAAAHAGRSFAQLSRDERDGVLRTLLWSYSGRRFVGAVGRDLEAATVSSDALALRRYVIADLIAAYYRSPQGWAVVGYDHYPGVPARDPRDYTRPL